MVAAVVVLLPLQTITAAPAKEVRRMIVFNDLGSISSPASVYMFGWRSLRRWGLKESHLPLGSVLLYGRPDVWNLYKQYIVGGVSLVFVETLLIFGLLWQRKLRRTADAELAITYEQAVRESEERFRLVANTAPVLIWMSGPDKLCTYFNQPWLEFTGRRLDAELGNGWAKGVHPEDLKMCLDTYRCVRSTRIFQDCNTDSGGRTENTAGS